MVDRFLTLYSPHAPQWPNVSSVVSELGWADVAAQTTAEYLDLQGIDRRWTRELVEAATRVNYGHVGRNWYSIHAFRLTFGVERRSDSCP